jgi:YjbE family integral membrane protein
VEWLNPEFFVSLFSIVIIDLFLAGDNAIVIGLAARNLPDRLQKRVIFFGTLAAILLRALATLIVVWLLRIPFLLAMGGTILIWIAYNLLIEQNTNKEVHTATSLWGAIRTIVVADLVMGLDNVLAVAGASHGSFLLVVIGLMISVPIMVLGSTVILRLIERFPWLIYVGSGILAFTAARMIAEEPLLSPAFANPVVHWGFILLVTAGVIFLGRWRNNQLQAEPS